MSWKQRLFIFIFTTLMISTGYLVFIRLVTDADTSKNEPKLPIPQIIEKNLNLALKKSMDKFEDIYVLIMDTTPEKVQKAIDDRNKKYDIILEEKE